MADKPIGTVMHWFGKVSVAGVELTGDLAVGDRIRVAGHTTDFEQDVVSMQVDNQDVTSAGSGDLIGIKLESRARVGDNLYKVT